jgi:hypothetical protein
VEGPRVTHRASLGREGGETREAVAEHEQLDGVVTRTVREVLVRLW